MGRKPNQRVLEYFDRGPRLDNNSNRYEHTCKACGELFPKGRIESLIAHIERTCASIRRPNGVHVSPPISYSPHPGIDTNGAFANPSENPNGSVPGNKQMVLPLNGRTSLSGLEALVEASTQLEHPPNPSKIPQAQEQSIDPSLEQQTSKFAPSAPDAILGENMDYNVAYSTADTGDHHALSGGFMGEHYMHQSYLFTGVKVSQDPAALSMIAASATNLQATMPQVTGERQDRSILNTVEGASHRQNRALELLVSHEAIIPTINSIGDRATRQRLDSAPGSQTSPPSALLRAEDGAHGQFQGVERHHGRAQKVRGKFTDSRRQEVQNIRKKGACIRCRMLRKTCSDESPCKTCASVSSARVWKLDCVRTNIYKELDLFHAGVTHHAGDSLLERSGPGPGPGLFEALTSKLLKNWQGKGFHKTGQSSIRLSYLTDRAAPMFFSAQFYTPQDSDEAGSRGRDTTTNEGIVTLLNEPTEQISTQLLPHMQSVITDIDYEELHPLTGPTLRLVLRILKDGNDKLVAQAFDHWTLTQVMTSSPKDWRLFADPSDTGSTEQQTSDVRKASGILESDSPETLIIIVAQLQAVAHQKASTISRNVMIDLEKRLGRKTRCQGFETFLVGILLLSCVERMCWAIKSVSLALQDGDWPLEHPVDFYLDQAARFTDFLSKLFQMRGILLHVRQHPDDGEILHAHPTVSPPAERWLSELRLTKHVLEARQAATFDPTDYRCFDFGFCSRLFLVDD